MTTVLQPDEFNQVITGDIFLNTNTVEIDVDGNIVSDTLTASTRLTRTGIGILNTLLNNVDFTGVLFNATGFAYQSLTSLATVTWENLSTKIQAISALSQATNATTLNINNAVRIQNGETEPTAPLQYIQFLADPSDGHNKLSLSGSIGTANQVLASGGANGSLAWVTQTGGTSDFGTLAEVLNEGAIADRDIDMDNNDLLNVRTIENLDASGYEGIMTAQQNYVIRTTPATSQGWGVETWENGAYNYVEDTNLNFVEMVASSGTAPAPYNRPVMEIYDTTNNKYLLMNSSQIQLGTTTGGLVAPTVNAFLGTDASGNLQYSTTAPTSSNLATVLVNSTPDGNAGGQPINNLSSLTFTPSGATIPIAISSGVYSGSATNDQISLTSAVNVAPAVRTFSGNYLPIYIGSTQYFIQLYSA
jgi:hypothetical protein